MLGTRAAERVHLDARARAANPPRAARRRPAARPRKLVLGLMQDRRSSKPSTGLKPVDGVLQWLLGGDPAIRWQTLRDLVGASARAVEQERSKVASDGWGVRLLAEQDAEGTWAGGHPTAGSIRQNGRPRPTPCCCCATSVWWRPTGQHGKHAGFSLIAMHLLEAQMADGGWNCRRPAGATHASMHTTISVLEGLRLLELHCTRDVDALRAAQRRGREFLLVHRLFRSPRTGSIIKSDFTRFVFPPRWHYDILRALDYFQAVDAPRDPRLAEAIDIVTTRQREDGRWSLQYSYKGKTYFQLERIGMPSRWNTLRALRVLKWWNRAETAGG